MSYNSWVIPIYKNTPVFDYVTNVYAIWCQLFILSRRDETVKPKTCYSTRIYKCHASSPMAHACWLGFPVTPTGSHWSTHCHSLVKYLLSIRRLPGIWGETGIGGCGVLDLRTCWDPIVHNPPQLCVCCHHVSNLQLATSQQPATLQIGACLFRVSE